MTTIGPMGEPVSRNRRHSESLETWSRDGTAIRRTPLTSNETVLMWTPAGMAAAD